jgi:hypothetical protein
VSTAKRASPASPQNPPADPAAAKQERTELNRTPLARAERLLNIAVAPRKDSARWTQAAPLTWEGLLRWLDLDNPASHRECAGYVGGLLRDGIRKRDHVESRSLLTLDADKAGPSFLDDIARVLPGVAVAAHTTWSHGVKGSRYRLLAPLSRDLNGEQYTRLAEAVRDALGAHWSDDDKGCPEPERFMFRPSTQGGYAAHVADGEPLDVEAWLRAEPPQKREAANPPAAQQEGGPLHPYAASAVEAELARLDECDLLGWQGPGWNNTTFAVGCVLVEFANSPWSGYTLDQAEADLLDRAPTDEDFGPDEHAGCWASALAKVGDKGRPRPGGEPGDDFAPVKPRLDVSNTAKAADWLRQEVGRQGSPLAGLFRRGGELVHTPRIDEDGYVPLSEDEHSEDGPAQVRPVNADRLRSWVQFNYAVARYVADKKAWKDTTFPGDAAKLVVNAVELAPALRPLAGVTHTPMLRKDGSVLSEEGYDEASARLYLPEPGMAVLRVPDEPSASEVKEAHDLIAYMLDGFPFNTEHDRANYLALLFTPLLRVVVPPPYPLGLIHAHQPGSGKGHLATILRTLHGGALRALPESNAEMRKQITSILSVTTAPVVQFDNVTKLESSALDALLTADTWDDRPLGATANFTGRNDRLWVATGNNVSLGGDLLRRVRWVSIDPNMPNPEQRTDFAIKDLPGWVRDRRGELLVALLTLLRAWVVAGRPLGPEVGSDSFAYWTRAMQGVLGVAGWTGTVGHPETVQQEANDDDTEWGVFLAAVSRHFGREPWTVKEMLDRVVDEDELPDDMSARSVRSAGMWLKNRKGRWAGGYVLRPAGFDSNKTALWRVQQA